MAPEILYNYSLIIFFFFLKCYAKINMMWSLCLSSINFVYNRFALTLADACFFFNCTHKQTMQWLIKDSHSLINIKKRKPSTCFSGLGGVIRLNQLTSKYCLLHLLEIERVWNWHAFSFKNIYKSDLWQLQAYCT